MHSNKKIKLINNNFSVLIADYLLYLKNTFLLKDNTLHSIEIYLDKFFNYLNVNEITDLKRLNKESIIDFFDADTSKLSSSYKSSSAFKLRRFLDYLFDHNYINIKGSVIFPVIKTDKRDRLLSFYSIEDLTKIVNCIDRSSIKGKRDFAIILFLIETGVRSGDLIRLKISDIKWNENCISFIQQKTHKYNLVTIGNELKIGLIDYLKNARPKYNSELLFIGKKNKGKMLSNSEIASIVSNYYRKAKIDISGKKHCAHSLRHSLATNLLKENTPTPIIQSVLGHSSLNTTQYYLNVDYKSLKKVALEDPTYEEN